MRDASTPTRLVAAMLGLAMLTGCGGGNTSAVTGTITMDGQPLQDAYITFLPQSSGGGGGGRPAAGRTDSEGHYELIYGRDTTGAVPGTYRVEIRTYMEPNPDSDDPAEQQGVPERVPAQYNADSELTAVVETGGNNVFDYELSSEGPIKLPPGAGGRGGY